MDVTYTDSKQRHGWEHYIPPSLPTWTLGVTISQMKRLSRLLSSGSINDDITSKRTPSVIHEPGSYRARWAKHIAKTHVLKERRNAGRDSHVSGRTWLLPVQLLRDGNENTPLPRPPKLCPILTGAPIPDEPLRICIIGGGISGLYLGMLLDDLGVPHASYEIIEASNRTGGRIYTHRFGPSTTEYYDVGAMRFPKIPPLKRTFDLFERSNIDLAMFDYEGTQCPSMFNGVSLRSDNQTEFNADPYRLSVSNGGLVPYPTVAEGPESILKRAFAPFIIKLANNFQEGFAELMKYDHMTTRDYLREYMELDFYSIWYLETVGSASGLYDQALSEAVLDAMDFEYPVRPGARPEWYRVAGGTSSLVERIESRLSSKPSLGTRVTSISYNRDAPQYPMSVQVEGEREPRQYSAVFNTTSLPCLRRIALGAGILSPGQRAAVQAVHYDASTKIAIKFRTAWWTRHCRIRGGQATTDLPIRTCVYPSSPEPDTGEEQCSVLLCSYTWGQDAQQMASLIARDSSEAPNTELKNLLRHNLALLHQNYVDPSTGLPYGYYRMLSIIEDEYDEHHAYDWYADPCTSGAFAYFGPGQFRNFYPELAKPAARGNMFLVGEACSAHHAWVSGSLDSAYRGLIQYLYKLIAEGRIDPSVLRKFRERWGPLEEISDDVLEWQVFLAQTSEP